MYARSAKDQIPLKSLEDRSISIYVEGKEGWNKLLIGACNNSVKAFEQEIKTGLDIGPMAPNGRNALLVMASYDYEEILRFLLFMGANFDATDWRG